MPEPASSGPPSMTFEARATDSMVSMQDGHTFRDPHRRQTISLTTVPIDRLEVVEHQRKTRPSHVEHLVSSIERMGFIVPLVAVEEKADGGSRFSVIEGQHRLEAAREVGLRKLPVLVVPGRLATRMMNLNVEKDLNIREKGTVSLGIYRKFLDSSPDLKENDPEVVDSIETAYYVTLGLAYERGSRLAGSSFEPLLKKMRLLPQANARELVCGARATSRHSAGDEHVGEGRDRAGEGDGGLASVLPVSVDLAHRPVQTQARPSELRRTVRQGDRQAEEDDRRTGSHSQARSGLNPDLQPVVRSPEHSCDDPTEAKPDRLESLALA